MLIKMDTKYFLYCCEYGGIDDIKNFSTTDDVHVNDLCGNNGFILACKKNNIDVIKYVANELKVDTKKTNNANGNGFTEACNNNQHINIIRYLIHELKIDDATLNEYKHLIDRAEQMNRITLMQHIPKHIVQLYLNTINPTKYSLANINPVDFYKFMTLIDQYPSINYDIRTIEIEIIYYIKKHRVEITYQLEDIIERYQLRHLYAFARGKLYV